VPPLGAAIGLDSSKCVASMIFALITTICRPHYGKMMPSNPGA
jgi:hypothetical protein